MSVNFNIVFFIIYNCENFQRSMFRMLYFEERMRMLKSSLTFLTEIKVRANWAFITCSSDISLVAVITSNSFMNYNSIFDFFDDRFFNFRLVKIFRNNFFINIVLCYERLIRNSWSFWDLLRNLNLNSWNDIWKHLL